jgi:outer membrane lipoprotein-sorting protein
MVMGEARVALPFASSYDGGMKHTLSIAVVIILASIAWHAAQWVGAEWEAAKADAQQQEFEVSNWEIQKRVAADEFEF